MDPSTAISPRVLPEHRRSLTSHVAVVLHRWPVMLGVAFAAFSLLSDDPGSLSGIFLTLILPVTTYVVVAVLVKPRWSWPVIGLLVLLVLAARLGQAGPVVELAGMAAIVIGAVVVGFARGTWRRAGLYRWQPHAAMGFLALSLGALWLSPEAGRIVIAVCLVGHGLWDLAHWQRHEVVSRSLAEWCGALDLTLGLGVLGLTMAS